MSIQEQLERGRELIAAVKAQRERAIAALQTSTGSCLAPNREEEQRLVSLIRRYQEWELSARELGLDVDAHLPDAQMVRQLAAALVTSSGHLDTPAVDDLRLELWLEGAGRVRRQQEKPEPMVHDGLAGFVE